jgi:ankyrin repeat protein
MGLVTVIDRLLDAGDDVNASRANTDIPLIMAARNGRTDAVRRLLNAGSDPHGRGAKEMTALHVAENAEITGLLLKAGAIPDARDKDGETPLFSAARAGRLDQIRLLVDANAEVDLVNDKNEAALVQAAQRGAIDVVDYLLDAGAKPSLPGQRGPSFASVARRNASLRTYMTARAARGCIDAALAEIARSV